MPFTPHTEADIQKMLATIGVSSIDQLFDEVPDHLKTGVLQHVPSGIGEMDMMRVLKARSQQDEGALCFIGAGAYEHHIPAAVWDITTRGEFLTAYTPYQAEASQGTLQLIYEYQTMMANLTAMDISNASLYDGASGLAEAVLMAVRANRKSKSKKILVAGTVNPTYRKVVDDIVSNQQIYCDELAVDFATLATDTTGLKRYEGQDYAALIVAQPNFFGTLEQVDQLTDWAHEQNMLVIAVVNPIALALLSPPGEWGQAGADIAVGEGQPLGIPLASGGPYFGFLCCKQDWVRQMPGRLIGRTVDLEGKEGFTLTLQAREQHIRRSKATSNICTNQGLAVTAATIHMSLLGYEGLNRVALACHQKTAQLKSALGKLSGVQVITASPYFHELVVRTDNPVKRVLEGMAVQGILGGVELSSGFSELENCFLVCVTEVKSDEDIDRYVDVLTRVMSELSSQGRPA
jgi:glycine dehydrogenase subunit 1